MNNVSLKTTSKTITEYFQLRRIVTNIFKKMVKKSWISRNKNLCESSYERMKHFSCGSVNLQLGRCVKRENVQRLRDYVAQNHFSLDK